LGFAYLKLDDKESARGYLVDVIERFPNSKAAKLAKNLLSNIK
jgi:TolA-binding protein